MTTRLSAIDFTSDIAKLTDRFTGRQWVFDDIDRWLKQSEERFFILTGEPGVGKSAIAARLTQIRDDVAAYHFCRAGDVETVRPARILRSLAAQLGEHLPDYGQALANTIKPIHLRVEVNITIGSMTGSQVTGVYIENLKESDPENELDILIRAPLEELQKMYAERQQAQPALAIILVDSLDEAVTTTGTNVVELLAQLSKSTSLPAWVRFILTSRPEDRVMVEFEPLEPHRIEEMSGENRSDIREYVKGRVEQPVLQELLGKAALAPQTLIDEVTQLSSGNFLYTKLLLNDIEAGRQPLDDLSALPKSIDEIYLAFLRRFKPDEWKKQYQPILGTLTVTQEPVTEDELANFTKIRPRQLRQDLGIIRQFLDTSENGEGDTVYAIFHQSLRDYLLHKKRNKYFWCDALEQHDLIIDHYQDGKKSWDKVALEEIDRYGRRHLAQHLVKGDRVEELHTLLSLEKEGKNAWFKMKDDEGDTSGFLADIELAWAEGNKAYERKSGKSIGLQCRYALIKSSINSLAEIPAALMIALVKHQYWKPTKALAYARQIPDPQKRFESLTLLADQLPSSELLRSQVLQAALEAALDIRYKEPRVRALTALANKLPQVLPQALETAQAIENGFDRAWALTALADKLPDVMSLALEAAQSSLQQEELLFHRPVIDLVAQLVAKLPNTLLPLALETVQVVQEDYFRADVLVALVPNLTDNFLPHILQLAQDIQELSRIELLTALGNKWPTVLPLALGTAHRIQDEISCARVLTALGDKDALLLALKNPLRILDNSSRYKALLGIVSKLTLDLLPEALEAIQAIKYEDHRSEALTEIIPRLTSELIPKALKIAVTITDEGYRSDVLLKIANKLPEALSETLEFALNLQDKKHLTKALVMLIPKLPVVLLSPKLPQILGVIRAIQKEEDRIKALIVLIPKVPETFLSQIFETAQAIRNKYFRAQVLTVLGGKMPELLPLVLEMSQNIESEYFRAHILTMLGSKLSYELLPQALANIYSIQHEGYRAWCLRAFVPNLPHEFLPQVLESAQTIQSEYDRAQLLMVLSEKLPEVLPQALVFAQAIQSNSLRAQLLMVLSEKLPEVLPQAMVSAQAIQKEIGRAQALVNLVPHIPEVLPQALVAVQAVQKERCRAHMLTVLADTLTPELLPEAVETAQEIQDASYRARALTALALPLVHASNCFELLKNLIHFLSDRNRSELLSDLTALTPVISASGEDAIAATAQAIEDVSRWWP